MPSMGISAALTTIATLRASFWLDGIAMVQMWLGGYSRKSGGVTWGGSQSGQTGGGMLFWFGESAGPLFNVWLYSRPASSTAEGLLPAYTAGQTTV